VNAAQLKALFAANVNAAIAATGRTNRSIGDAIGVTHDQVSKWRRGANGIGFPHLTALADELDLEPSWFYADHEQAA